MKTTENKSTHSQQHTQADRSSFEQERGGAFFSEPMPEQTPFFHPGAASLAQPKFIGERSPFFQPATAPPQPGEIQQKEEAENENGLQMQPSDETIPQEKQPELAGDIQTKSIWGGHEEEKQETENLPVQTKVTVGKAGDKYEQEADNMAAQVMAMSDTAIQRQNEENTELIQPSPLVNSITRLVQRQIENKEKIRSKSGLQSTVDGSLQASPSVESNLASSKGGGSALSDSIRGFMEPRFGADLSYVRVHTDSNSVQMNKELGAQAFTHGNDIYYGAGKAPGNNDLTAHELTHTIQQTGGLRLNKQVQKAEKEEKAIAAKELSISASELTNNKELRQKPITSELEQTSESLQAKRLTNYPSLQNKGFIQPHSLQVSQVNPRIQGAWLDNPVEQIKAKIAEFARQIPGYRLLALILGKDPVSGTPVERNATNLIRGLLSLIPNGENIFNNLEQSGALQRAFNWFNQEVIKLNLSFDTIKGLFASALQSLGLSDALNPFGAFEKIKNIFTEPIIRIKNFVVSAATKVMEFTFEGLLNIAGGAGAKVMEIIRSAGSVLGNIIKNPIGFAGNLVAGVKAGFQKFASNIQTHLKQGLTGWLFGAMAGAGLALPAQFDLKGILSLVLQVLGLTYNKLRGKLVQLIGEPRVKQLEQAFDFLKTIITGGLAAAWQKITEFAGNLQEMVIGGIRSWVQNSIITAAITKLISMFNPAGAIVQAVMAIYNTIMFFIERGSQIAALAQAVFTSIGNIAAGNIAGAATYVEQAMARSLPVMISFLARLIGLGGISEQIKNVIKRIQAPIENAMNKLANFVVEKGKSLLGKREDNKKNKDSKPDTRSQEDKLLDLSKAVTEAEEIMNKQEATPDKLNDEILVIKSKYKLTSAKLTKDNDGAYYVNVKINPEKNTKKRKWEEMENETIPLYRGVHFLNEGDSEESSEKYKEKYKEKINTKSEGVLTPSQAALELAESSTFDGSDVKPESLQKAIQQVKQELIAKENKGEKVTAWWGSKQEFDNQTYALIQRYVNNYGKFRDELEKKEHNAYKNVSFSKLPFISTSWRAKHPARYALGGKLPTNLAGNRRLQDIVGRIFVYLFTGKELKEQGASNIQFLQESGKVKIKTRILNEEEVTFKGGIPGSNLKMQKDVKWDNPPAADITPENLQKAIENQADKIAVKVEKDAHAMAETESNKKQKLG